MHRRHARDRGGYTRLLVPLLQGAQGQVQFGTQYSYVTRETGRRCGDRHFRIALRPGQHGLHLVPLLLALSRRSRVSVRRGTTRFHGRSIFRGRLPFGNAAGPVFGYSPFPGWWC